MDLVETDQGTGRRVIAFEAWNWTRGHLGVTPTAGPQTPAGMASAQDSGEALINMVDRLSIPCTNNGQVSLRARWSSQLPRVSNWSVRYQGVARDPRALIESPIRGIGVMNALSEAARREIRFIYSHMVGQTTQDNVIRFEVGETAAREIQAVIRRTPWTVTPHYMLLQKMATSSVASSYFNMSRTKIPGTWRERPPPKWPASKSMSRSRV